MFEVLHFIREAVTPTLLDSGVIYFCIPIFLPRRPEVQFKTRHSNEHIHDGLIDRCLGG